MADHSRFSPSAAHRWLNCTASMLAEKEESAGSTYAEDGTRMHEAAAKLLTGADWLNITGLASDEIDVVSEYVDYVKEHAQGGELYVEERVDFSDTLGVEGCFGTVDALVVTGDTLKIIDLKTGRGVRVEPEENEQLMLYALGALEIHGLLHDISLVELHIVQPRLDNTGAWPVRVETLQAFGEKARGVVRQIVDGVYDYAPAEKTCRWCPAKATCPALTAAVSSAVVSEFETLSPVACEGTNTVSPQHLADMFSKVGLVEDWCKAIREAVFTELSAGRSVPGFKLVEGRKGPRQWSDAAEAEKLLKSFRMKQDDMYELKLISPTTAEKRRKAGLIGDRQWPKLEGLITQKDGGPSVAPDTDPRPAISLAAAPEEFEALA